MAIINPVSDAYEALLTPPTTRAAVFPTAASNFAVALDVLLTRTTSKRSTEALVEMDPPIDEGHAWLLDEPDDVEERSETEVVEELVTCPSCTPAITTRRATGSEDAFQSYLRDIRRFGRLTRAEEIELARQAAEGDELAARQLIETNLRLVIAIARRYGSTGVPLVDLIQEGNLALMHATEKFDYRRGCHFGTYSIWWIRQAVSRAATDQSRLIHLPEHVATRLRKVRRVAAQLSQENGLEPLPEHIAEASHINLDEVIDLLGLVEMPFSLDTPLDDEERYTLADTIEDNTTPALAG